MIIRTNQPAEHVYDLGPEIRCYGDGSDGEPVLYEMDAVSPTDPQTAKVQGMRVEGGRCVIWGVDSANLPLWERDNDDVASDQLAAWEDAVARHLGAV